MEFSKRKVLFDTLVYTILPKLSFVTSLLILPWISPYLTLEDYGIYGLIMSYVAIFQIFINLGQNVLLTNSFFTYYKYKLIWRRSFALMVYAGIISSLVFACLLRLTIIDKVGDNYWSIVIITSIYLILTPFDSILINYYTLKERAIPYAYGMAIIGIITTFITLVTIKYFKMGYMGWMISLPTTVILTNIYFSKMIFFKEKILPEFRLNRRFLKKSLKIGLPLTPHQLSLYILGISDRLLLEYFKIPIKQIGLYSQGYNIGSQGNVVVNGIFQAFTKKIQEGFRGHEAAHRAFIRKTIIFIPLIISSILFLGSLWSKEVFLFLFRKAELQNAYPITIAVLSSYMFWSIYSFFTYPLSIKNQTFAISKITLLAASFNIIGNIILIPLYGIWASLGVTYVSYIIFGFAGLLNRENRLFLNRYINITRTSLYLFFINLFLFIVSYLVKDSVIFYKSLITISLLPIGFLIKKYLNYIK